MKAIIENNEILNLDNLLKDSEWRDHPDIDGYFCGSFRCAIVEINGMSHLVMESHICEHCNANISVWKINEDVLKRTIVLKYKKPLIFRRCPHKGEMVSVNENL